MTVTIANIEAARRAIAGRVVCTPMLPAPKLSALTGATVQVKYENMQVTNSFKERGALNKLIALTPAERARGVIAIGQFGCGIITISQFGVGVISISQFTVAVFALAQFAVAYSLIAQLGLYIHEGHGQWVRRLWEVF